MKLDNGSILSFVKDKGYYLPSIRVLVDGVQNAYIYTTENHNKLIGTGKFLYHIEGIGQQGYVFNYPRAMQEIKQYFNGRKS